jgi:hypothetical protein
VAPVLVPELFPECPQADPVTGPASRSAFCPIMSRSSIIRHMADMSHRVDIGHTVHMGHTSNGREPVAPSKRRSHVKVTRNTTYWETTYWSST